MVTYGEDYWMRERHPTVIGDFLQGSGAGGSPIRVGYMSPDPPHGKGPGKFPAQGFQADYVEAAEAT